MFTGIIESIGTVGRIQDKGDDKHIEIKTGRLDLSDVHIGDSISVSGVCLTVVELDEDGYTTDVSTETIACTIFSELRTGDEVNLEKALQSGDRLGGHMVSGHVDGTGAVASIEVAARSTRYWIEVPSELMKYVCKKGSICIDGVSLTVNEVMENQVSLNIIPHTIEQTIFKHYVEGTKVNIEVDLIARYLEGLMNEKTKMARA